MSAVPGATAGAAAAHAAAIAQAIKASGAIVQVDERDFYTILSKAERPVVIFTETRVFKTTYQYLTSYKGFVFYLKTQKPLQISASAEIIAAKKIWIPG